MNILIWVISLAAIAGILFRPFNKPEWVWACAGAVLLIGAELLPVGAAGEAVFKGVDVYLFLIGMMMLSELARVSGVFDYISGQASRHAKGSSRRLFFYIYIAGTLVTIFLSNDATAVVLTPAVYATVKKSGAVPRPYLFACAFIANAASFVLPISNPANLVVFQSHLPPVSEWLRAFFIPSLLAISTTYVVLTVWFRNDLKQPLLPHSTKSEQELSTPGKIVAVGIGGVVATLIAASALRWDLGLPTFLSATFVVVVVSVWQRRLPRKELQGISWGVIPLVGGLFIVVEALNRAGALSAATKFLQFASQLSPWLGKVTAAFGVGIAANIFNNLPVGLTGALAANQEGVSHAIKNAVLIGIDLGPNLSVTGSLATILWLIVLRREGESISGLAFFTVGLVAMPLALIACVA